MSDISGMIDLAIEIKGLAQVLSDHVQETISVASFPLDGSAINISYSYSLLSKLAKQLAEDISNNC